MDQIRINKENYEKFILKGSLALESYFDINNNNKEIYDAFNKKLIDYRNLEIKSEESKEKIVEDLISVIEKI